MAFAGVNYLAILAAAVAGFLFGAVWYGVFGKPWMAALGKTEDDIKNSGRPMPVLFAITFVALLVMAYVLAGSIGHLGAGNVTLLNGIICGAFMWVGFVATTLVVNHGYQDAPCSLTLIDGGHWLGVLAIQGAVIGLMGI